MTISINNAVSLLEECYVNGNQGSQNLHAWFLDNVDLIFQTIQEFESQNLTSRSSRAAEACSFCDCIALDEMGRCEVCGKVTEPPPA